jgi:3-oxoadipate enol-lactonase
MNGMETMVKVDGGTVWAEDTGGPGAPVVLLHPGVGDSRIWAPVMPRLAARYRVIRYDARGHGQSPPATAPYTLLTDLVAVLDQLEVSSAAFVGCSQGGSSSIDLALSQPSRVSALVLVSPGLTGYQWPADPDPAERDEFESRAKAGDIDGVAALIGRMWAAAGSGGEAADQLRSAARAWIANGDYEQPDPSAVGRLGDIRVPTVLLIGDKDYPPLIACDETIVAGIGGCRKIDVPGGDHLLPLRVPDLIADTIIELAG